MTSLGIILVLGLLTSNILTAYYLYKFSVIILNIESSIEESLDQLELSYQEVSKILEIDVFFDSVEIRKVINEIKNSKESIHKVAIDLSNNFRMLSESEKDQESSQKKEKSIFRKRSSWSNCRFSKN